MAELFVVWRSFFDVKTNFGIVSSSDSTFSALTSSDVFTGGFGSDDDPGRDHCSGAGPVGFAFVFSSCESADGVSSGFCLIVRALESSSELSFSDSESLDPENGFNKCYVKSTKILLKLPESENIDLNTSTGGLSVGATVVSFSATFSCRCLIRSFFALICVESAFSGSANLENREGCFDIG